MVAPGNSRIYKPSKQMNSSIKTADSAELLPGEVQVRRKTFGNRTCAVVAVLLSILMASCILCFALFLTHVIMATLRSKETEAQESYLKKMAASKFEKNDKSTIFWNFHSGYQTVKTQSAGGQICYIFPIDNSSLSTFSASRKNEKVMKSNVFHVHSESPVPDDSLIPVMGIHAFEECRKVKVMWLTPYLSGEHLNGTSVDSDLEATTPNRALDQPRGRAKRNIRSCRTSCCWRVCCCDVHHFIWEVREEFNCNHVCNKCSKNYKTVVQKIC